MRRTAGTNTDFAPRDLRTTTDSEVRAHEIGYESCAEQAMREGECVPAAGLPSIAVGPNEAVASSALLYRSATAGRACAAASRGSAACA